MVSAPFLRDLQALLSSTLASFRMLQPQAFGSLKIRRDLGLSLYYLDAQFCELLFAINRKLI